MVQIIKITSDWRLGEMNEREFINSVTRIADTYADYKKVGIEKAKKNEKEI